MADPDKNSDDPADVARERVRKKIDAALKDAERLRARVSELEDQLAQARREAAESDAMRAAVVEAARSAATDLVRALDEIIALTELADASVAMYGALSLPKDQFVGVEERFRQAVEAHLQRAGGRS